MDDDYEIRSNPSPVSGSPMENENRRITVTVASSAPAQPAANSYALALPIQQQARGSNSGSGGSGGREDCWSEGATAVLIDAWGERYLELNRGNLKQKHWKEVADVVSGRDDYTKTPKTDIQCKNRIDTVKKRYKTEKAKISDSGGVVTSKWQFYDRLDLLIGPTAKISNATGNSTVGNSNSPLQKVPLRIPVILHTGGGGGGGGANQYPPQKQQQQIQLKDRKLQFYKCDIPENSDSPVSSDSYPPEGNERKRTKKVMEEKEGGKKRKNWGNAMKEMSKAIIKFGEVYEQTETSKVKQIVEMENQRMQFVKDLELQRMQFFTKIQLQISELVDGGKSENPTNLHSNNSNDNNNGDNNKDNNNGGINNNDNNNSGSE